MESLILYGGSFDPIHNGHLKLARGASFILNAPVIFIPSKSPRWKSPTANINHRLEMLKIALKTEGCSDFIISDYELNKDEEINYTIDTVKHFIAIYPNRKIYLLIGADQVNRFDDWKDAQEIASLCKIAYVYRDGIEISKEIVERYKMMRLDIKGIGSVSSSEVRNLQSLDIPFSVIKYIEEHNLYYMEKVHHYLDNARFNHSLEVAHLGYLIATSNHRSNPENAYIAGLLHDIAKNYDISLAKNIMKEYYSEYINMPLFSYHQFIGAYLAKNDFKISNEDILNAIEFHATGRPNMSDLEKIIYSSDKIEPTRGYDSSFMIKSCVKNFNKGFVIVLKENRKHLLANNKDIYNELTNACMMQYIVNERK
jgi:nicotinate-nucleotide adenylyltransferase